jgi:hypothetical protein
MTAPQGSKKGIWKRGAGQIFFPSRLLPHKCGVPASVGTLHLCGSEEFCRAPPLHTTILIVKA